MVVLEKVAAIPLCLTCAVETDVEDKTMLPVKCPLNERHCHLCNAHASIQRADNDRDLAQMT
eukprot:3148737-Lingulodinium_polyedra.AAC.1